MNPSVPTTTPLPWYRGAWVSLTLFSGALLLTPITCCSTYQDLRDDLVVEPEVQPYVSSWSAEFGSQPILHLGFVSEPDADIGEEAVAWCLEYSDGDKVIKVVKPWWDSASPEAREDTVWHELGHCWGQIHCHNDDQLPVANTPWQRSSSVMASYIDNTWPWWGAFRGAYIDELRGALANPVAYCEGRE